MIVAVIASTGISAAGIAVVYVGIYTPTAFERYGLTRLYWTYSCCRLGGNFTRALKFLLASTLNSAFASLSDAQHMSLQGFDSRHSLYHFLGGYAFRGSRSIWRPAALAEPRATFSKNANRGRHPGVITSAAGRRSSSGNPVRWRYRSTCRRANQLTAAFLITQQAEHVEASGSVDYAARTALPTRSRTRADSKSTGILLRSGPHRRLRESVDNPFGAMLGGALRPRGRPGGCFTLPLSQPFTRFGLSIAPAAQHFLDLCKMHFFTGILPRANSSRDMWRSATMASGFR